MSRRKFTREFKVSAVKLVNEQGQPQRDVDQGQGRLRREGEGCRGVPRPAQGSAAASARGEKLDATLPKMG